MVGTIAIATTGIGATGHITAAGTMPPAPTMAAATDTAGRTMAVATAMAARASRSASAVAVGNKKARRDAGFFLRSSIHSAANSQTNFPQADLGEPYARARRTELKLVTPHSSDWLMAYFLKRP